MLAGSPVWPDRGRCGDARPDSPAGPSVCPRGSRNDAPLTPAMSRGPTRPRRERKVLPSLRTSSRMGSLAATPRRRSWSSRGSRLPAPATSPMKSSMTGRRSGGRSSCGRHGSSACVYRSRGVSNTACADPCSRISPSRITTTWSAISPTTARSWVMNSTDIACFLCSSATVSYTHLRAHETVLDLVCRLLLEKKKHWH